MEFTLLGRPIELTEGRKNYMKILTYYKAMAAQAEIDFKQEYDNIFGMVFLNSTWAEKFKKTYGSDDYMDNIVKRYVTKTRQYLANYGVYNLSDAAIWNEGIVAEDRDISRLQYEFNSYIIDCVSRNEDDDSFISRLKSKFSGNFFPSCLYNDVMSLFDFVLNYLDDNEIAEIQFVYKKDSSEAEAIYKNLLDSNIPAPEQERLAYSLIELDPRSKLYYEYIFCKLPQAKYEIAAIAQFLSIDLSDLIEKEIRRDFDLKSISSEEDALKMMDNLRLTMENFCVTSSSRKAELEKILHDFDVKARTYDGVLYDTRELRSQAEKDDQSLSELHGDVSSIDEVACSRLLAEIVHMQCTTTVKNKHLQLLNDRITTIWDTEDFERFTEIFVQTPVSASEQISKNCTLIRDAGRTETKELFIKALNLLNESGVEAAAKYAVAKEGGAFASLINMGKKETYETLTLNGRVMHPAILDAIDAAKVKKSTGILSNFGFSKSKTKPPAPTQNATGAKFCTACGTKLDGTSKFCSNCGNKLG